MNLQGSQRGGARDLGLHLLKDENEHVEVHELRGFVSDNLVSALKEVEAVSRGTKAKQPFFSLSLNPPPEENVSTETFEEAIQRVEDKLNLSNQPRAIAFHEKQGRRHCHAVWSRIDTEQMKAIPLPHTRYKLRDISRELYLENGWQMPQGYLNTKERDPKNFTHAQWQQAKRIGKDPREIKATFQDSWAISDTQSAFQQALKERGYTLAKGDRRGFVALDHCCEVFSVPKWTGLKTKEIKTKLIEQEKLPSVTAARVQIAKNIQAQLTTLRKQQETKVKKRLAEHEQKRLQMRQAHITERRALKATQQFRQKEETQLRQDKFNKGLRGLLDHFTGEYRRIKAQNEQETLLASQRNKQEKDALIFNQLKQRRQLQSRRERLNDFGQNRKQKLSHDIEQYQEVREKKREVVEFKERMQARRSRGGLERDR